MQDFPDYLDSMGRLVNFAVSAVTALTADLLREHGLTVPQWITLTALWREDGLTITALRLSGELAAGDVRRLRRLLEGIRDQGLSFFTPTYRLTMETPR